MNLSEEELFKEKTHLDNTIKLLRNQISELAQDLYDNEEKQKEFKKFVWDSHAELDPTEMKTIMSNNDQEIDNLEMKAKYYRKLYKIQNSPYFAKIVFESDEGKNDIYIGLTYLTKNNDNVIYDWRSPIASVFYDYEQGEAQYEAPMGIIKGYLHNKRQFTIEDAKIKRVFDSKLNVQDELLQEVLATEGEGEARFIGLLNALKEIYEENRIFLKPLVIDYHSSAFSRAYRQTLKDALKKDGNFPDYPEDSREYVILDSVMSGYIEMLLQLLDSGAVSMEEAFHFAYFTMEHGTKPALQEQLGIL